jgi:hypothetical protein
LLLPILYCNLKHEDQLAHFIADTSETFGLHISLIEVRGCIF